jgi:hypothetical protein
VRDSEQHVPKIPLVLHENITVYICLLSIPCLVERGYSVLTNFSNKLASTRFDLPSLIPNFITPGLRGSKYCVLPVKVTEDSLSDL